MKKLTLVFISIVSIFTLAFIFGLCIFKFAGSYQYTEGWLYLFSFFVPTFVITVVYLMKKPELIENRVVPIETRKIQIIGQSFAGILFIFGMLGISGLDYRFQWTSVPLLLNIISYMMIIVGFIIVYYVFKENTFASKAIEVMQNQKVISTGLYAYVRHPMYLGAIVIIFFTPLALDSLWGMISSILLCIYVGIRLLDEEKLLKQELQGYEQYCQKVKYHLIPFIW